MFIIEYVLRQFIPVISISLIIPIIVIAACCYIVLRESKVKSIQFEMDKSYKDM